MSTTTSTAVRSVRAWEALDSRGRPTVACAVELAGGGRGQAMAPAGASTGGHEATELRDGGTRYGGWGVRRALGGLHDVLAPAVTGLDAADQEGLDAAMEATDPDPALGGVGANAVLALSLAALLAAADAQRRPLWQVLDPGQDGDGPLLPMPMVNVVSGGAHAGRALDLQDVLVVPVGATSFSQALEWAWRVRAGTAEVLDERGGSSALVADEGGLAGRLDSNEAALALVVDGAVRAGLEPGRDVALALDLAANQLWAAGTYHLEREGLHLDGARWLERLASWCERHPVVSLEDVLHEDDWAGWRVATDRLARHQLVGDDLFATSDARLQRGVDARVANAVLVKPNQAGTVSRARRVVHRAHAAGYATVVSARSGDTEDTWLADLAVGWRAGQVKVGSTTRSERTAKWNRLLQIEAEAGASARFAGAAALAGGGPAVGRAESGEGAR